MSANFCRASPSRICMRYEQAKLHDKPGPLHTRHSLRQWMTWARGLPNEAVAGLWACPDRLLREGTCLQTKTRTTVARVELAGHSYLLKYHHWAGFWKTLFKSRAESPNRFSFDLGVELSGSGVPTPRPLACIDVRLGPFNICSYLLTEFVAGTSLYRLLRHDRPDAATIDDLARQVAGIWQSLDDLQLSHNDLKPENFMVDPGGRVWLIDLENAQRHNNRKSLRSNQAEDLRRLLHVRSWLTNPAAAEVFRQRLQESLAVQAAIAEPGSQTHWLASDADVASAKPQRLTVLIPCRESVHGLSGCVDAVRDIADEILLAIPDANDAAWNVAENLPECRTWWCSRLDAKTLRRAIAAARHPWILVAEPNERLSPDLAKEIQFLLADNPTKDGYRIECRNYLFGRGMRFGDLAADTPSRLVRRDGNILPSQDGICDGGQPDRIGKLRCRIIRHGATSIEQWNAELTKRTADAVHQLRACGKRASFAEVAFAAPLKFVQSYFLKMGFLDGVAGLRAAIMSATFEYAKYATLWRLRRSLPRPKATSNSHSLPFVQQELAPNRRPSATSGDKARRAA